MKVICAACLAAAMAVSVSPAAQTAPRRDGNWEVTVQMEMPNMPQGMTMPPMKMTHCVTPEDAVDPQKLMPQQQTQGNNDCKVSDYKFDGNKASFKMACSTPLPMTGDSEFVYGADSYTGLARMTLNQGGQPMTMNMKYAGKRLGDCTK